MEAPSICIVAVDLRDWDATKTALESLPAPHGVVNNAGVAVLRPILELEEKDFDSTFSVNVKAALNVTQIASKKMIDNHLKGSIVNVSSQAAMAALADHAVYCSSKAALDGLTRSSALELGRHGIRINSVNPTVIMTDMGRLGWSDPEKSKTMLSKIPLGRFGEVDEVINAVLFLLSDQSSLITGTSMPLDGGFTAC
ncbi:L-xylulose reductase-like [Ctenocephalides felis]|nr:L-xylulose reductase-like [Ctenocephalides felis]